MASSNGSFVHMLFAFIIGVQIILLIFALVVMHIEEANYHGLKLDLIDPTTHLFSCEKEGHLHSIELVYPTSCSFFNEVHSTFL